MSKGKILNAIRKNKPSDGPPLPGTLSISMDGDPVETFTRIASESSKVIKISSSSEDFKAHFRDFEKVVDYTRDDETRDLDIDVLVIKGQLGVCENGAIWVDENTMGERILPFVCQHLAIVLDSKDLVGNMHEAYGKIKPGSIGFGVFIAGPSKTADIEQSLVIGAHGPRSLTIFLNTSEKI